MCALGRETRDAMVEIIINGTTCKHLKLSSVLRPQESSLPSIVPVVTEQSVCSQQVWAGNLINKPNSFKFEIDTPPQQSHCQIVRWLLRCVLLVLVLLLLAINSRGSLLIN